MVSTGDENAPPVEDFIDVYEDSTDWMASTLVGSTTLAALAAGLVGATTYWSIANGLSVLEVTLVTAAAVFLVALLAVLIGRR